MTHKQQQSIITKELQEPLLYDHHVMVSEPCQGFNKSNNNNNVEEVWMVCNSVIGNESNKSNNKTTTWCTEICNIGLTCLMPLLLWIQFYFAFANPEMMVKDDNLLLNFTNVQITIVLFVISSYLYRYSLQSNDNGNDNTSSYSDLLLLLLPEIITDVILFLILLKQVHVAWLLLLIFTLSFSICSIWNSCTCTIHIENHNENDHDHNTLDITNHVRTTINHSSTTTEESDDEEYSDDEQV